MSLRSIRPIRCLLGPATILVLGIALAGCVEFVVASGATVGVAAYQERGVEGAAQDTKLATQIRMSYLESSSELTTNVGIEVYESRVLLTGLVNQEQQRADAVKMAWAVIGVKDVINEIQLRNEEGIVEFAYDAWISTQLQSKLTFDKDILSINYSIETVNSVVYLIGIAQSQEELERVLAHAHSIDRVRRVISHVRIKDTVT